MFHEWTLPPIGKIQAPRYTLLAQISLYNTHKWDSLWRGLKSREQAHVYFSKDDLQFGCNIITLIKSCPGFECMCFQFHPLQHFLPIYN